MLIGLGLGRWKVGGFIGALVGLWGGVVWAATPVVLESNGVRVSLGAAFKVHGQIKVDGIPFIDQSRLYALRPNAGGRFFGYEDDIHSAEDTKVTTAPDGTLRAEYPLRAPNREFTGTQVVELTPGRSLSFQIDGAFNGTSGRFEHRAGGIYTGWLSGRSFKAELRDGTTTSGIIPNEPRSENLEESTVVRDFKKLTIETPLGNVEIKTSGSLPVRLQDYRRNRYFDAEPLFWLGVSEMPMDANQRISYGMEITFPAKKTAGESITERIQPKVQAVAVACEPPIERDIIVPTPKNVVWGTGELDLGAAFTGLIEPMGDDSPEVDRCVKVLMAALYAKRGELRGEIAEAFDAHRGDIRIKFLNKKGSELEHYHLKVDTTAELTAETTEGLVAGIQTLRQLMRRGAVPGTVTLRKCEIDDYATLPFRCIHFFAGANDSPTHIKLLEQLLAPLKLNELCYHADNLQWQSHPEIKNPAGNPMSPEEVRKVVDVAHRVNVDVIPLVASFGHSEWMLTTPELRKLAENPDFPYAYDPTNPAVYKIVEDLYSEAIDLFHPRYFHIGHDEVDLKGFPQTERLKKIGLRKLFADDVLHYRNWFAARGIHTIIWGDMLVGPGESPDATLAPSVEEAKLRRESLPKDVIVGDWHYVSDPAPTYKSLGILNDAGFDTVAVTWMHPLNVVNFSRAAAEANETSAAYTNAKHGETLGILQSTWSGSKTNDEVIRKNSDQYACYVLAAEAAWNGGSIQPDQLPYDFREFFSELWLADMLPNAARPGWKTASGQPVQLASRFAAGTALPGEITYPVDTTASLLLFDVASTSGGAADPPIATTDISYDDGTSQTIDWKIGYNVLGCEDHRSMPGALIVNSSAKRGEYIHRYAMRAQSARIKQITFKSANQGPGLVVHGVTGVQ